MEKKPDVMYCSELIKGSVDTILLSLIMEAPMYGYQISRELERRSQGYFVFKEGTLYPALRRLEKKGLVSSKWEDLPNGRRRRYYYITGQGLNFLKHKKAEWQGFSSAVNLIAGLS